MVIIETERQDLLVRISNSYSNDPAVDVEDSESSNPWYNGGDAL